MAADTSVQRHSVLEDSVMLTPSTTPDYERFSGSRILAEMVDESIHPAIERVDCDWQGDVLTLRGVVPTFYFKQLAQEAAIRLQGVSRVDNQIEVRATNQGWHSP
jgi:osmotically-inducible protein OsmY